MHGPSVMKSVGEVVRVICLRVDFSLNVGVYKDSGSNQVVGV